MQGMSFLVAWITSDANTELTDKSSSLKQARDSTVKPPSFQDFTGFAVLIVYLRSRTRPAATHGWVDFPSGTS